MQVDNVNNYNQVQSYDSNHIFSTKEAEGFDTANESNAIFADEAVVYEHGALTGSQTIYNSNGVLLSATSGDATNRIFQNNLKILGFYDPFAPSDGNLGSAESVRAIKNFQRVFGIPINGGSNDVTRAKLNEVISFYNNIKSADLVKVAERLKDSYDYNLAIESANTRKTWTFLRLGMGLDQKQAAGVMGNLLVESGLSPINAQNRKMPEPYKLRDAEYEYFTTDGIGYGLLQWTHKDRKAGLMNMAYSMGSSVSDLNVQFAYMKAEMEGYYADYWNSIKASKSIDDVTRIFWEKIESPVLIEEDYDARIANANAAYNALKSY